MEDKQIIEKIKKIYKINVIISLLIRENSDSKVYLLKTEQEKYIARISKRDIQADILFEVNWLDFLLKQNIPVVKIINTKNKKAYFLSSKSVLVLFEFAHENCIEISPTKKPNLKKVMSAAHELARIHNISDNMDIKISRKRNILAEIDRALKIKGKLIKFSEGGEKFIKELIFYKKSAKQNGNDKCLVHNDYRPGNIFFDGDEVSTILDFDWSCQGPATKDVAHSLCEWSFPDGAKKHWEDFFTVFLTSYNQIAKNKTKLNNNLYRWICFSCLSDTATYFADLARENSFKKITSSYMYQKFLYFERFIK